MEAPLERVFELILAGRSARKCGCSWLALYSLCTGSAKVLGDRLESH